MLTIRTARVLLAFTGIFVVAAAVVEAVEGSPDRQIGLTYVFAVFAMVTLFFAVVIAWIAAVPRTWVGRHPWRASFAYGLFFIPFGLYLEVLGNDSTAAEALPEVLVRSLGCVLLLRLYIRAGRAWLQRRRAESTVVR